MESDKARFVDGYTALKAAQRAAGKKPATPPTPKKDEQKPAPETKDKKIGAHIGRTVLPTKYEVVCYECGFSFQQTGRSQSTQCLKCRTQINFIDYTIDTESTDSIKTAGTVRITEQAVIKGGEIVGGNVLLSGKVEGGKVKALKMLELNASAQFEEGDAVGHDLKIGEAADYTFKRKLELRNVDVAGTLKAKLHTTGLVTIRAGALLQGELLGAHLAVEEGGGLKARVSIEEQEDSAEKSAAKLLKKTA